MKNVLSQEEYEKFCHAMGSRLIEHFDGFAIVGFHAGTGQPAIFTHANDFKTKCALNDLLRIALVQSCVSPQSPPDNGAQNPA